MSCSFRANVLGYFFHNAYRDLGLLIVIGSNLNKKIGDLSNDLRIENQGILDTTHSTSFTYHPAVWQQVKNSVGGEAESIGRNHTTRHLEDRSEKRDC